MADQQPSVEWNSWNRNIRLAGNPGNRRLSRRIFPAWFMSVHQIA